MYNPNEDKRENDNNIEPIHGHGENEREERYSAKTNPMYRNPENWNRM